MQPLPVGILCLQHQRDAGWQCKMGTGPLMHYPKCHDCITGSELSASRQKRRFTNTLGLVLTMFRGNPRPWRDAMQIMKICDLVLTPVLFTRNYESTKP